MKKLYFSLFLLLNLSLEAEYNSYSDEEYLTQNFHESVAFFKQACEEQKIDAACKMSKNITLYRQSLVKSYKTALKSFKQSCEDNSTIPIPIKNFDTNNTVALDIYNKELKKIKEKNKLKRKKQFTSCTLNGIMYHNGYGVNKQPRVAKEIFTSSCENNESNACALLGKMQLYGYSIRQNYVKSKKILQKACDLNSSGGCSDLASIYENGLGVVKNKSTAKEFYAKACDFGNEKACQKYKKFNELGIN